MQLLSTFHIEVYLVVREQRYLVLRDAERTILVEEMLDVATIALVIVHLNSRQRGNRLLVDLLVSTEHRLHHQLVFIRKSRTRIVELTGILL